MAFALSVKVTFTFLTTTPSLCLNIIYKQLILATIHRTDLLVIAFNLYLVPAPYLVSTIYEDEALTNIL